MAIYDLPTEPLKKDDASRVVLDRYETARRKVESRSRLWSDWYAAYRSYHKADQASVFRSKLFIPTTFSHIESHLPRLAAARPRIEVWGRGSEDADRAKAHRALSFFFWDQLRMDMRMVDFAKSALIYGTSWWKVGYRRKTRVRRRKVVEVVPTLEIFGIPVATQTQTVLRDVAVREWDGPTVSLMEPEDVYFDPDGFDEDTAEWIIERSQETLLSLEEAVDIDGEPFYDKAVLAKVRERMKPGNPVDNINSRIIQRKELFDQSNPSRPEPADPYKRQVHVLTMWTDDKVVAIIEELPELPPIRNKRNDLGMKPFARFTPIPLPNEMNGISMVEALYSIQYSQNLLTNARFDHVMQTVHGMHTVRKASNLTPSDIRFRPSGIVPVIDHNDVRPLEQPRLDFSHYREADFMRLLAQEVSGSSDIYRGIAGPTGDTATESSILAQAAASRVGLMFQILSAQSLHRLGKLWIRYNELYLDRERQLRILGDEFRTEENPDGMVTVTPEQLASGTEEELDLVIDVAQTEPGTRQFRLQRTTNAMQMLGERLPPGSPLETTLMTALLEGLGYDHAERKVAEHNQWLFQQQQLAAQQQQAAAGDERSVAEGLAVDQSADAPRGDQF